MASVGAATPRNDLHPIQPNAYRSTETLRVHAASANDFDRLAYLSRDRRTGVNSFVMRSGSALEDADRFRSRRRSMKQADEHSNETDWRRREFSAINRLIWRSPSMDRL
jgi:hypothetical protein